jgi:CheY-like chemotaxis protein
VADEARKRLLVVDDEKAIRNLLMRIAERAGFQVDVASDGVEALELLERNDYVIAIIDLMMPRLSGYELVERMAMLDKRPIVLVATAMSNGDLASLDDSMVRRVIRKPFDIDAVAKVLVETAAGIAAEEGRPELMMSVVRPGAAKLPITEPADVPPPFVAKPPEGIAPVEEPKTAEPKTERPPAGK